VIDWFAGPSYVSYKIYIFVNIVYHSYGIRVIAVSIKNIVDSSNSKQFVITHTHVGRTRTATALRQHIASALWRVISLLNSLFSIVGKIS